MDEWGANAGLQPDKMGCALKVEKVRIYPDKNVRMYGCIRTKDARMSGCTWTKSVKKGLFLCKKRALLACFWLAVARLRICRCVLASTRLACP